MKMRKTIYPFFSVFLFCCGAGSSTQLKTDQPAEQVIKPLPKNNASVVHVYVALCDNRYQGIVPVPAAIGNGQNPQQNLYWGASLGVKNFLKNRPHWKLVHTSKPDSGFVLERIVFKHRTENIWLVADAYDGKEIKTCTINFLKASSGNLADSVMVDSKKIYCGASAGLVTYIGHNGLMDFKIEEQFPAADKAERSTVILACISKSYFTPYLKTTGAKPLLWTTGLMCPEAYTLDAAITSWMNKEDADATSTRAAQAYHQYQHCGIKGAKRLLVSGW
jgi:hypothetical protein